MLSCRVCSLNSKSNISLTEVFSTKYKTLTYLQAFNTCTSLEAVECDKLPQCLCLCCCRELITAYEFQRKARRSDRLQRAAVTNDTAQCDTLPGSATSSQITPTDKQAYFDDLLSEPDIDADWCESDGTAENDKTDGLDSLNGDKSSAHTEYEEICIEEVNWDDRATTPLSAYITERSGSSLSGNESDAALSIERKMFPKGLLKCDECGKCYFTRHGLRSHSKVHCKKEREEIAKLDPIGGCPEEQAKNHGKESKPSTTCQLCGKQLSSVYNLKCHMIIHTGKRNFLCSVCPKTFPTNYKLEYHMRTHTGVRPYQCPRCDNRFLSSTTLKAHMMRHTGERPYECNVCGKRFTQNSTLTTHMKMNHMDRTLQCHLCDKKYVRYPDLNLHLISHTGDKPYACDFCPNRYVTRANLNKHTKQQHPWEEFFPIASSK